MDSNRSILLSIQPRFVEAILSGKKTVELRRVKPREISSGSMVLVYASSPTKALVCALQVADIIQAPISQLWALVGTRTGIGYEEFSSYFNGLTEGTAILFGNTRKLNDPIPLEQLRNEYGIEPPQSFRYLDEKQNSYLYELASYA